MHTSWKEVEKRAVEFSKTWEGAFYEKGECQTFYNDFFEVFGIKRRSVARFEEHVRRIDNRSGFIDLLWPKRLIVEHKSRGGSLEDAADQAGDYFDALAEEVKPRYQLVCDFQRFSLIDRDTGGKVEFDLPDLHKNLRSFSFMLGLQAPKHRVSKHLNVQAAQCIGKIQDALSKAEYAKRDQEILLTRIVFCLFADNTGIFQPRGVFVDYIESRSKPDGSDLGMLLAFLFQVLDTPLASRQRGLDPELTEFPFINGGMFSERITIPTLSREVRDSLLDACEFDWSEVSPAIFGSLYQAVLSNEQCGDLAAFATSEKNIKKVIDELFLNDLQQEFKKMSLHGVSREESLFTFLSKLVGMTFFDPACGCGNFLAVAYRELRRLELAVLLELNRLGKLQVESKVSQLDVDQFYGIEVNSYSARIASTAMWMTDHIANNELSQSLGVDFIRVPLVKKPHIAIADALSVNWESIIPIVSCSYLFSNPPYKGSKKQSREERVKVREIADLGGAGGTLDYACGWILKAADYARGGVGVGLVTTNSVVQGEQVAQLWPLLFEKYSLELNFAHQTFQWSTESRGRRARVQVVVIGLVPKSRNHLSCRLFQYATAESDPTLVECNKISPYLIVGDELNSPYVTVKKVNNPINGLPKLRTGTKPIDGGYYILDSEERRVLIDREPLAKQYIRPFVGTTEFLEGIERYILVLQDASAKDVKSMRTVKSLIERVVKYRKAEIMNKSGTRKLKAVNELYSRPTAFHITTLPECPFLVLPEVTSENRHYLPIGWLEPPVIPSNLVKIGEDATLEQFALLTSAMHLAWLQGVGGHLEGRNRYSIGIVYNNFPIPDKYDSEKLQKLAKSVLKARDEEAGRGGTLEMMYDVLSMPSKLRAAHAALDNEVDKLYLGKVAKNDHERLVNLLNRYSEMI
ncbi:DNA methyltransferase [Pseudodesulfovibrio methanolicus]|uniref:site-specific DNA-methyltransferase (adenine-specific) n=1 Tax=Pseudodesulfovibrio methanolicus TaxID=3126690 RepID=A0ABZ2J1U0_9BACT